MISKKNLGILILAGSLIGSNYLWYDSNKVLEERLDSRMQAIESLDNSIKKQAEYVEELKQELANRSEEVRELQGEVTKAQQLSYKTMQVKITAYSIGDSLTPSNVMANGETPRPGFIALNEVPLGTRVRYNGQIYIVGDRCGTSGVMDIYMDTVEECYAFGVKYGTIEILD